MSNDFGGVWQFNADTFRIFHFLNEFDKGGGVRAYPVRLLANPVFEGVNGFLHGVARRHNPADHGIPVFRGREAQFAVNLATIPALHKLADFLWKFSNAPMPGIGFKIQRGLASVFVLVFHLDQLAMGTFPDNFRPVGNEFRHDLRRWRAKATGRVDEEKRIIGYPDLGGKIVAVMQLFEHRRK